MNRIHVAYHGSAQSEASRLSQKLQNIGWQVLSSECGAHQNGVLSDSLLDFTGPTLVLLNDGLLHSLDCQRGLLAAYKKLEERPYTHCILASSMRSGPGDVQARVLTSLDRVSDVIRYMNYWQNAYLIKRRELGSTSTAERAAELAPYREISQEVGEFLKLVRKDKPQNVYDLLDDDGELLVKLIGNPERTEKNDDANTAQRETSIPPIPIIDDVASHEQAPDLPEPTTSAGLVPPADKGEVQTTIVDVEDEQSPDPKALAVQAENITETQSQEEIQEPLAPSEEEVSKKNESLTEEAPETIKTDYFPQTDRNDIEKVVDETPAATSKEDFKPEIEDEEPTLAEIVAKKAKKSRKESTKQLLLLIEEDELEDAFSYAEYALNADPGNAQLRYYYAVALLRAEEEKYTDVALHELDKLVKGDFAAQAHMCIGHVALDRRDYGMARRNLEAAYSLNKKVDSELSYRLGALIQDEYFEEPKKARKYLTKATKKSTFNKSDAWYRLAQLDLLDDKLAKAKKKLKKALNKGERHPFAAYDLATIYLREDNIAKAHKLYLKAINANQELDTAANQAAFSLLRPVVEPEGFEAKPGTFETRKLSSESPKIGQLTVLITGASSGIGAATARVFAEHGHRLILTGRRVGNLRSLGAQLNKEFNVPIRLLSFDVTAFDETEQLLGTLPEGWNEIDVLINNAGKAKGLDYIHQGRLEHWEEMIDTNIKGLLYMIRLVSPKMVDRQQGHIINVCSTAGHEVYPKGAVYCATKHAVDAITQGTRLDLHSHGIRVSQVSPAHVEETEFAAVRFDGDNDKAEKVYKDFQPLRARDVAKSIYYIAAQPEHVNVQDVLMLSTQQANSTTIDRSGR